MTKTASSNHFFGGSGAGFGSGLGTTKGCLESCSVIFVGGLAAINGCSVVCSVRVTRFALGLIGAPFTTNGSLDACSVPCMTSNLRGCSTAFITFSGFALLIFGGFI